VLEKGIRNAMDDNRGLLMNGLLMTLILLLCRCDNVGFRMDILAGARHAFSV
jgi:hypothetical protein